MKRAMTVSFAALALAAAGCGGDDGGGGDGPDKAEYEREVRAAGQTLEKTFGDIGTSIGQAGSPEAAADKLEEGASALDKAATDLGEIEPPSEVQGPHDKVVGALGKLADEFRDGAKAAQGGDPQKLLDFATSLQNSSAVKEITEAGQEFEKKGYDFGGGGGGGGS